MNEQCHNPECNNIIKKEHNRKQKFCTPECQKKNNGKVYAETKRLREAVPVCRYEVGHMFVPTGAEGYEKCVNCPYVRATIHSDNTYISGKV